MIEELKQNLKQTYRTWRQYSEFQDSPYERLHELSFNLFASRELPNIILGGAISSTLTAAFTNVTILLPVAAWAVWVLSVINYMAAQEVIYAYKAASREFDDEPRGIW